MGHRQTFVRANVEVDEGIARLVSALSEFPSLITTNSCEGAAFVDFRFGASLDDATAFLCWLSRQLVGIEQVRLRAEWGGGASIVITLTLPPHSISEVTNRIREAATAFRSSVFPCDTERRESRNSQGRHSRQRFEKRGDLPANLPDLMLRDLQT